MNDGFRAIHKSRIQSLNSRFNAIIKMKETIIVYADCVHPSAKGDFVFAANIAKELQEEIEYRKENIAVILASSPVGIKRFVALYGPIHQHQICIDTSKLAIYALDVIDPSKNEVSLFIDANRCKVPPASFVKRILSARTKYLYVGAPNQCYINPELHYTLAYNIVAEKQPDLFQHFSKVEFKSAGLGENRLGISKIKAAKHLVKMPSEEFHRPAQNYGFIYFDHEDNQIEALIAEFISLSDLKSYCLVGQFSEENTTSLLKKYLDSLPSISFFHSLSYCKMRQLGAYSERLAASTGTMSTLELMQDRKLTYYQYQDKNYHFVLSYLTEVRASCLSLDLCKDKRQQVEIIELAHYLFSKKPLALDDKMQLAALLKEERVGNNLIEVNQAILKKANGQLGKNIFSLFSASKTRKDNLLKRCEQLCLALRRADEDKPPSIDKAIRRAATRGHLVELKLLEKSFYVK